MMREYSISWRWDKDDPLVTRCSEVMASDSLEAEKALREVLNLRNWRYDIITTVPSIVKHSTIAMTITNKQTFIDKIKQFVKAVKLKRA